MWPISKKKKAKSTKVTPEEDPTSLGNLLVDKAIVTSEELVDLIKEFRTGHIETLLGQFLVKKGLLTEEQLDLILVQQKKLRNGAYPEHYMTMELMDIADRTQGNILKEVEEFTSMVKALSVKASK